MAKELTPDEVGAIAAVMGVTRERIPAEQLAGYDAKKAEQAAKHADYHAAFEAATVLVRCHKCGDEYRVFSEQVADFICIACLQGEK